MTKYTLFTIIIVLRIGYQPALSQQMSIENNKIFLDWTVGENETVYQFEIEKSNDGKNFTMAALVFGSDKPATDNYRFYEKADKRKVTYRIKIVNKDKKTEYSSLIEVSPKA
jgi:hypothetical protein